MACSRAKKQLKIVANEAILTPNLDTSRSLPFDKHVVCLHAVEPDLVEEGGLGGGSTHPLASVD